MDSADKILAERTLRTLRTCLYTLTVVNERITDPHSIDYRVDYLLIAEELATASYELVQRTREIAWRDGADQADVTSEDEL
jgi:hypothetical protein